MFAQATYLILFIFSITQSHFRLIQAVKITHTVWLPAGKVVQIPCKLRAVQAADTHEWWAERNQNLKMDFSANSVAVWHDRFGRLVHVGDVLLVQVPSFEASELSVTQYVPRETTPTEKPMSLAPEYKNWIGGTNQLLAAQNMDTITCTEFQTSVASGYAQQWKQFERETHMGTQIFFTFRTYSQPIIIWNYAVPPEIEFENRTVLLKPIREWCQAQRSIRHHSTHVCSTIYEQRRPFTNLATVTDRIPLVQSTGLGYTEYGIVLDLTSPSLHFLADPTTGELGYLHARLKQSLDMYILRDLENQANLEDMGDTMTVATRIQAICPPGSHTYMPIPALQNLNFDALLNKNFGNSSASSLMTYQMLCHPCPDGHAPRAPYAFDRCHNCPRGFYLGSTGWPSSAGCLACPEGFTTDRDGATSRDECQINAGALTRKSLGYLLSVWFELQKVIVGVPGPEIRTRALGQHQHSAWAWLGRTSKTVWICASVYCLVIFWLVAMAIYRLHLYFRLQTIFKNQYRLLLKAALIGQINLVSHIKQRAKQTNTVASSVGAQGE